METAVRALISFDEQLRQRGSEAPKSFESILDRDIVGQASDVFSRASRGHFEAIYPSLGQYPPSNYFFLWTTLLEAESHLRGLDLSGFVRRVQTYVTVVDKDFIRLAPQRFAAILRNFTEMLVTAHRPSVGIRALKVALGKFSPTPDHLTPIHALIAQLALLSKNYKAALSVLDRDVTEVEPQKTDVQPLDALLYFYYGGMIYIGLKQYRKAQDFLSLAISAPAQVLSAVVIESHKKYILVSLLLDGQATGLPKHTASFIQRQLKNINTAYLDFAKAYQTYKQASLQEMYVKYLPEFQRDRNAGLAAQVVESLYRRNIIRLTQTYVTLSLADIATAVKLPGPKEAEFFVLKMIEDGEIYALINQKDSMVSFQGNPEGYNSQGTMSKLDTQLKIVSALGNRLDELQRKIASSPQHIHKLLQSEKGSAGFEDAELDGPSEKHFGGIQFH